MKAILQKVPEHLPSVFALGIVSQIAQVLFLREFLMVFQGSELSIGLILAAWLIWVGVGSQLAVFLNKRIRHPTNLLGFTASGLAVIIPVTIILIRGIRSIFNLLPGTYLSLPDMALACFTLMAPTCLLLGIQFVTLAKVWREKDQKQDTTGAAKTYIGEAAGNIIGGLTFTFLLVQYLNSIQAAAIISLLMVITCLWVISKQNKGRPSWVLVSLSVILVVGLLFSDQVNRWSHNLQWQRFAPEIQLIDTHQSKHGTISILKQEDQFHFFQSGHLLFSTAGPETAFPGMENQDAIIFTHLAMTQHQQPRDILLVGGGLRGVLNEIIQHPVEKIDYVELDEKLTNVAIPHLLPETLHALEDERVTLIHRDGRLFVKTATEKYDLIIVDLPDPATAVLNRFYTYEFFLEVKLLLNPDGVFIISAMSTPGLRGLPVVNRNTTLFHTLNKAFPKVLAAGDHFLTFFSAKTADQVTLNPAELEARYIERHIDTAGFSPDFFYPILYEPDILRTGWIMESHGRDPNAHLSGPGPFPIDPQVLSQREKIPDLHNPVNQRYFINSDLKPIAYFYTLMFLDELTRGTATGHLTRLLTIDPWWLTILLGVPLIISLVFIFLSKQGLNISSDYFPLLNSVFSIGFSAMTLQIALIFSFQSVYGFIYETIGVIIALFMLGLAAGSFLAYRFVRNQENIVNLIILQGAMASFSLLIAASIQRVTQFISPTLIVVIFSGLTITAGLINGLNFPLASASFMSKTQHPDKATGIVYSTEVFGACFGAILASVVIAPIFGIIACCLVASMINITSSGILILSKRL